MSNLHPPKVHLWFPEIYGFKGGIQVYSAFLLSALQQVCPQARLDVFLKHDTAALVAQRRTDSHHTTHYHTAGSWPSSVRTAAFAAQLITQGMVQRPQLVIATHLNFAPAAYWLHRMAGVPYWVIAHGIEAWHITDPSLLRALHAAPQLLAVSGYTRDRLAAQLHIPSAQMGLLPNTIDTDRFRIAPKSPALLARYALHPDQPLILTVARLAKSEQYKGHDQILRALPAIRAQIPHVHYLLIGKGDDLPRLERMVADLNLQESITFAGFVPDDELADHYNLCDLFAMPSKGEGFGIVFLEALSCGIPTLGGNQDGALDALCHGDLGVLVDPDDMTQIAATITAILQRSHPHPLLYRPQALRQAVIDTYGMARFQQRLAAHLQPYIPIQP